jgi:RNA polymerase sigma-70 factor (ECF subfamily)
MVSGPCNRRLPLAVFGAGHMLSCRSMSASTTADENAQFAPGGSATPQGGGTARPGDRDNGDRVAGRVIADASSEQVTTSLMPQTSLTGRSQDAGAVDDATLARYVLSADPRAATALWNTYVHLVRGILRRMLGRSEDVEDVVQDTFMGLFRTLGGLRQPEALRSFVVGATLRVGRNELRRRRMLRRMALTPVEALPDIGYDGGADLQARRAMMRLCEVLGTIDDRGRTAFVLRHVEGLELAEVAASLGCSLATAKRSLARVRGRLRAMVAHDPHLAEYARMSADFCAAAH